MNPEELLATTKKWKAVLDELNVPFIIYQSMVLGLMRNGYFFHERVAEIAVLGEDIEPHIDALKADSRLAFQAEHPHAAPHCLLYFPDCEIAPIYAKGGKAVINMTDSNCLVWGDYLLDKSDWTTFRYMDFDWPIPGHTEQYLTESYGDWRIPKPNYAWARDARNIQGWDEI